MLTASTLRENWEILACDVVMHECVGRGACGEVFRGHWRDMAVAVKVISRLM